MQMAIKKNGKADPEVLERPKRRTFTAEYKMKILREIDGCKEAGEIGALLRREGLYSSTITHWRKQRDNGAFVGLGPKKRGRKPGRRKDPMVVENDRLRRENARLQQKLGQAEAIIEIQKKVSQVLGIPLKTIDEEGSES